MILRTIVEGLKSVIARSLTTAPEASRPIIPLSLVFMGGIAGISLILAEIFFGLSTYKVLRFDYGYSEGLSMLMATLVYITQMIASILIIKHHLKKITYQNAIVKEYKLAKDVVIALIEGYKSK